MQGHQPPARRHPASSPAGVDDAEILATLPEAAVLTAPAAPVSLDWAIQTLRHCHGIAARLTPLAGERDANFLVETDDGRTPPRLFRISHPDESALAVDFQSQALLRIAERDPTLPVQRLLPAPDGRVVQTVRDPEGRERMVRLFSYLDGRPMRGTPWTAERQQTVFGLLARLDTALADLQHEARDHELPWDITRADRVRPLLTQVADPVRRALAETALDGFEARVKPKLQALRRQPIHNDFNISNLLVQPDDTNAVAGIIDFGDLVFAPMINDLAVAAAYQLELPATVSASTAATATDPTSAADALAGIVAMASAYDAVRPLQTLELDLLLDLMRARMVMVVAISGWRSARQPENAEYLMRNNAISWARLAACGPLTPEAVAQAIVSVRPLRAGANPRD